MKKSKLYKLVKESIKEVIQEQSLDAPTADLATQPDSQVGSAGQTTATQAQDNPDFVDDASEGNPEAAQTNNDGSAGSPFCYYGNSGGFAITNIQGTDYIGDTNTGAGPNSPEYQDFGTISVQSIACNSSINNIQASATIEDTWICCGDTNQSSTTVYGQGQGWDVDGTGNHGPLAIDNWSCYCPTPTVAISAANGNYYLIDCGIPNNTWDFSMVSTYYASKMGGNPYPLSGDGVISGGDMGYGTGARCAGCTSADAIDQQGTFTLGNYLINDLAEYFTDIIGCPTTPGDYTTLDEDDITCCNFEGCIDETSTYSNADASTPGAPGTGAYNYTNSAYVSAVTSVTHAGTTYTPSSFLNAVSTAGATGTFTDDGSCNYAGCTSPNADNTTTNSLYGVVNVDDGSCTGLITGCQDAHFDDSVDGIEGNYDANANDPDTCILNPYCPLVDDGAGTPYINFICNITTTDDQGSSVTGYFCGGTQTPDTVGVLANSTPDNNYCEAEVLGCTDNAFCNYDPAANTDDGSCSNDMCTGCMDDGTAPYIAQRPNPITPETAEACNLGENILGQQVGLYDPSNILGLQYHDAAYCDYTACAGCIYDNMDNTSVSATIDDGSCVYTGCLEETNQGNGNIYQNWVCDGSYGHNNLCTDDGTVNGNPLSPLTHNTNLGTFQDTNPTSCTETIVSGCTDPNANNYNPAANTDDGSCTYDCYRISYVPCNPEVHQQSGELGCVTINQQLPALQDKFKMELKYKQEVVMKEKVDRPRHPIGKFEVTAINTPTHTSIQDLDPATCYPTTYKCRCLPNLCPTNSAIHAHRCIAVVDGSGDVPTMQECMDFCPCEITNPYASLIQYTKKGIDSCEGHTGEDNYPVGCMSDNYGVGGGMGDVGKDDPKTVATPSDPPLTPTIDIPNIDIPGIPTDTPPENQEISEVKLSKNLRKRLKNLYK